MRTPILKPGPPPLPPPPPQKKKKTPFQCHSWLQIILWKNTAVISNLAPPAWNSITRNDANDFNVLSVRWYITFYDAFFVFFCYFTAARSNAINLHNACKHFMNEETWNKLELLVKMAENICIFKLFPHLCKNPKDKWVDRTFTKTKGKFFTEIIQNTRGNATNVQSWS